MLNYNRDFFTFNRWLLCCAGLHPPKTKLKILQFAYKLYAVFVYIFVNIYFTSTEFMSLFYTYKDLPSFIKNLNFSLCHFMGAIKVTFWFIKGKKVLRNLMDILESADFLYDHDDKNDFHPREIAEKYKKIGIKSTLIFYILAHMTLVASYIPPLITVMFNPPYYDDVTAGNSSEFYRKLPYYSWMPFTHNSPKSFLLALGYQSGPMFSYAYSIVGMDTIFTNLMNSIAGHFAILQGAFMTVVERAKLSKSGKFSDNLSKEMKKTCCHLQTIFEVCERLENVHKYLTLGQATATLFIFCTSLYLISSTPFGGKQFFAEVVYTTTMGFQLFLYCWFGNELTLMAEEIPTYIWKSTWIGSDLRFQKDLIYTMMRLRKPICVTVGKFAPLTLSTFVSIIKTSYSAFAVIKNTT